MSKENKIFIPKNNVLGTFPPLENRPVETIASLPPINKLIWQLWISGQKYQAVNVFKQEIESNDTELVCWYFWCNSILANRFIK